jgi:hypothetical protein
MWPHANRLAANARHSAGFATGTGRQVNSDSKTEYAILNLRIDGMSRHGKVDAEGVTRSINAVCTCVRALWIKKLENRQLNIWIKEASFSNWHEKFGVLEKGQEARVYVLTRRKRRWLVGVMARWRPDRQ